MFNKIKKFFHTKDGVEQQEINKQLLITFISVCFTVVSVIGVSFAAFVWSDNSEKEHSIVAGNISLTISSDSEPLGSGLNYPVNDSDVDSLEPYTFTITNNGSLAANYTLKLVDDTSAITSDGCADNQIDKNYIYGKVSGAASISNTSLTDLMSVSLDTGMLRPGQSKTYNLTLWINQSAPNSVIGGHFHGKIQLETSQIEGEEPNYDVVAMNLTPIDDNEIKTNAKSFPITVSNTTSEHLNTTIKLTNISIDDALKDIDFRWGLYNADTNVGLSFGTFKYSENSGEEIIYRDSIIDTGAPDKNYILRIWIHDNGTDQAELLNKSFSANIEVIQEPIEYTDESCFTFDKSTGTITGYDLLLDESGNIVYDDDYGIFPVKANKCPKDIVIPKSIDGVAVTKIGGFLYEPGEMSSEFAHMDITSIIIPDSVTKIGEDEDVELNNSIFDFNKLTHITIPESVTYIGPESFSANQLTSVFIPENISLGGWVFLSNKNLTTIVIPKLESLEGEFVGNTALTNIILMDGIASIEGETFMGNTQLTTIEIPSSVKKIGLYAFSECTNLTEIVVRGKSSLADFKDSTGLTTAGDLPEGVNIIFRP